MGREAPRKRHVVVHVFRSWLSVTSSRAELPLALGWIRELVTGRRRSARYGFRGPSPQFIDLDALRNQFLLHGVADQQFEAGLVRLPAERGRVDRTALAGGALARFEQAIQF